MIDIIILFALFASAITVNKLILYDIPPVAFVGIRMLLAGILLSIYQAYVGSIRMRWSHIKQHIFFLISIALATTYISSVLKAYGLKHLLSSKVALIGSLDPFITALYSYIIWRQRLKWQHIIGMLLGFSGVIVMLIITRYEEMQAQWWFFSQAELAALGSICITRLGWLGVQRFVRDNVYTPAEINTLVMLIGGSCALLTAAMTGELSRVMDAFSSRTALRLCYTVFVGNVVAYTGYAHLLKRHPVTLVSLSGLLIPLFVHLYGPIILDESLSGSFFISLTLVGIALWIFNKAPMQHAQS